MVFVITLLLFAVFFYLLMRLGCGARMVHGDHFGLSPASSRTDPVCGMRVDGEEHQTTFEGRVYRFCSSDCQSRFTSHPEAFALKKVGKETTS